MDKKLDPKVVIPHVFLPLIVPGFLDNIEDTESEIITRFADVVNEFQKRYINLPEDLLRETITTFNAWAAIQSQDDPDYKSISHAIENLDSGESFALFIRAQNTGLLISFPADPSANLSSTTNGYGSNSDDNDDEEDEDIAMERGMAFVSTFPASQKSTSVTTAPRGLAGVFPTTSVTVPRSKLLKSSSFAKNLSFLTSEVVPDAMPTIVKASSTAVEVREVPDTIYVSKWLTAILMDDESRVTTNRQVPRVIKKIRDNVCFDEATILPFRRSGLWMTIKVVLQVTLIQKHGMLCGTVLYKMIILKFLLLFVKRAAELCATGNPLQSYHAGLFLEMMRKIARRSRKLQQYIKEEVDYRDPISDYLVITFDELMKEAADALKDLRKHLKKYWESVMEREKVSAEFYVPGPKMFLEHRLNSRTSSEWYLLDYLEMKKQIFYEIGKQVKPTPAYLLRHPNHNELLQAFELSGDISEKGAESVGSILFDFEINVSNWERLQVGVQSESYVWTLFQLYILHARMFYARDPVGYSRMVLTCLKIIHLWDRVTLQEYPMLAEHPPGINLNFTEDLLLPEYEDMKVLLKLENYFRLRESVANPRFPSLISEQEVSQNSFAVRFARCSREMMSTRDHLLKWGNRQEQLKLQEVHERRIECEKLNLKIGTLECEYQVDRWKRTHNPKCQRCVLTKRYKKYQVDIYEHPLPNNEEEQNAVMFELMIPAPIAVLRDLLYLFGNRVTSNVTHDDKKLHGPWTEYVQIRASCQRKMPWLINLLSTKKLYLESHYKSLHPTNPDSDFVKQNGFTCHYGYHYTNTNDDEDVKALLIHGSGREKLKRECTFRVTKKTPYANLQWAIEGNRYSSNEVLSKQNECHPDMSLVEFVEFGSLRVHYSLQTRNIFRVLTQMSLSFKNESVYNLICQALWETGPRQEESVLREAHQDFEDPIFIEELLQVLGNIHMKHSNNWRDHFILLMIIQIALRVLSVFYSRSDDKIVGMAVYLLGECREVSVGWSEQIEVILATMVNAPRSEIDALRIKLVEINICTALTFSFKSFKILEKLLSQAEILKCWLSALAKIYDNLVLIVSGQHQTREKLLYQNPTLQNLLRRVQDTGIFLDTFLQPIFCKDPKALNAFVKSHYRGAASLFERCGEPDWGYFQNAPHVYYSEVRPRGAPQDTDDKTGLQMDAICGGFLVNGFPVSYLPSYIEEHEDFQRAFPTKSFEVQPYQSYQIGRMITKNKYHESYYSFYLQSDRSLIITEHYGDEKRERQLVPHRFLKGNVPFRLVENYTHWLCYKTGMSTAQSKSSRELEKIEFFYRDPKYPSKLTCHSPTYVLDLQSYILTEVVNGRPARSVVDIKSEGVKEILKTTQRLEHDHHVIIFVEKKQDGDLFTVELPRMGLRFNVTNLSGNHNQVRGSRRQGINLISQEYRGMKVAQNQKLGTLIGLRNGLLLEDANVQSPARLNSILLVPHGIPIMHGDHDIEINTEVLRNPPFFAYEVDDKLRQLKGGESQAGWVFLSLLHGLTSSPLPDPFTLMTGTERAFQILQSGNAWSCSTYDNETLKNFDHILKLVPQRAHYPPNMKTIETVKWPTGLSPYTAHDGYLLLIRKLFEDSERMIFLFPEVQKLSDGLPTIQNLAGATAELCLRAYWRRVAQSTEVGRITYNFDEELDVKSSSPPLTPASFIELNSKSEVMEDVLQISQLIHSWRFVPPLPNSINLVKKLLLTGTDLKGIYPDLPFPSKESMKFWADLNFRDSWIDLYNLARVVKKKHLESEWIHVLTYYAFRGNIDIDHLLLLQTVAVNSYHFTSIDPPDYEGYTLTNEYEFDLARIKQHLESFKMEFEFYLDTHSDEVVDLEDLDEFKERMRPGYEELVGGQIDSLVKLIADSWPSISCDKLFQDDDDERFDVVNYQAALPQINLWLKAWFQNIELVKFINRVELTVSSLVDLKHSSQQQFADTAKELIKGPQTKIQELRGFCHDSVLFTIDLDDILMERDENTINYNLYDDCAQLFDRVPEESQLKPRRSTQKFSKHPEFPLDSRNMCPIMNEYVNDLRNSWAECHRDDSTGDSVFIPSLQNLEKDLKAKRTRSLELWEIIKGVFLPNPQSVDYVAKQLISAEIYPRITPVTLLPYICIRQPDSEYLNFIVNLIGCYAILLTQEQQAARCVRYCGKRKKGWNFGMYDVELKHELANPGHMNWNPSERPEWLLFEIENDLMIRDTQSRVAEKMENPDEDKNALLQLNMGEGKTAVIVPLLVLSLANGDQLARVTVLKPLFHINQKALLCRVGGLVLNRRLYNFPCRRDYVIGRLEAREILKVYKECLAKKGVVISLPEYRLSFLLKGYEKCRSENFEEGGDILGVQEWILDNARDILDESDEILHVKYQLIYTLGKQVAVGGGSLRWIIIQKLLKLVPKQIENCLAKYGSTMVEIKPRKLGQKYPFIRLLKSECYEELSIAIATEIINGHAGIQIPEIAPGKRQQLLTFLTNEKAGKEVFQEIFELYQQDSHRQTLLIIRGVLGCGVLNTALSKRWRVNFGVNPTGFRRMAVPFRAKDVAAEKIEFGHPDIAILLTQLSYYYSGLSDTELEQTFVLLFLQTDPDQEYQRWINSIPKGAKNRNVIECLTGVNLKDFHQRTKILYPALRKNMSTIDFWLSQVVFPQESKQFGWKIGTSPWDLCLTTPHPTTGFSGTNDSKILLPKTITQRDLPELQGTNGQVLRNLLGQENDNYEALPFGFTGHQILTKLTQSNIRVLLDVGALMLELNNEQVAERWLQLVDEDIIDAAVYFDQSDNLVVLQRHQTTPVSLELSTFRTRLDRCVIYLDDVHTRGTDLKIPPGMTGAVTLGKGVTKDKLVQGCMRMRKLGQGHNVRFWASQEVHDAIVTLTGQPPGKIGTKHVLEWSIENSRLAIQEGFIHWASAGVYQAQKLSSHVIYESSQKSDSDLKLLAESCSLKETIDLNHMYGDVRITKTLPTIVKYQLKRVERELGKHLKAQQGNTTGSKTKQDVADIVDSFGKVVVGYSEKYVPNVTRASQAIDEEQERELEHEIEAQMERQNPPKVKGLEHQISDGVSRFIEHGDLYGIEKWALKLPLVLKSTSLWKHSQSDTWGRNIYVTFDFARVAKQGTSGNKVEVVEQILRPVHWFCSVNFGENNNDLSNGIKREGKTVLLLLSPFEVNHYLPHFRSEESRATLHMFAPRLAPEQDTLYKNTCLWIPSHRPYSRPEFPSPEFMFPGFVNSSLLLFSGSSYFASESEQNDYCVYHGFCLRPRTTEEEEVFNKGGIINGFLKPGHFRKELGYTDCRFQENPEALIRGIIERRYGSFPVEAHVGRVIFHCIKPLTNVDSVTPVLSKTELLELQTHWKEEDGLSFGFERMWM